MANEVKVNPLKDFLHGETVLREGKPISIPVHDARSLANIGFVELVEEKPAKASKTADTTVDTK